ncbi:hypothetical protein PCASD_18517 [Puccinia coronata f. sp. avenae]|uniref:Uncharacterized protein n=1 Tax=Puccinia coronata f. sp. avenae TaxID=200324 RepID=A0A2N5SYJ4_9BASI|nr:hypothetical protein PCASD_18517 [Puccinia coronata f. sp. avenae]
MGLGCSDGCGASPAYVFDWVVLEALGGCAAPPAYVFDRVVLEALGGCAAPLAYVFDRVVLEALGGCAAPPAYVFDRVVLEALGGCAAPPAYVLLRFGREYLAALERPVSCQMSENPLPPPSNHLTHALDRLLTRKSGDSHTTMSTGLPLVRWLGRSITPAYPPLALGPIWLTQVDPLDRTGIGVASVGTCLDSTQPALASLLLCIPPGISIGHLFVFPLLLPQRSATCRMTVIRTAKATCRSTPYPYQSSISRLYRRRRRASLTMNHSSAEIRTTPAAVLPPFEDIYFDSNGVLFRNGIAVVDHHGSIIRRSVVERPPPTPVAPENLALRSNWAILGHLAHRINPPVYDPYPPFVESRSIPPAFPAYPRGPVPPGLESLPEHLRRNGPGLTPCQGANSSSEDAQMRPASKTRGRLIGDPARIAEATRVFNEAHDLIVDHFYNTAAPPVPRPASEPRAPTTDPIDTDSDPADAQSEPLLTNDQGDPVSTTYPFTNFSCPATPNPPGFFDPEDYHRLDDDQIHALLRRDHEPARFDRFAFGPQHLTDLYQSAMSAMVSNYTRFPPRDGAECADRVQTFKFITRRYHSLDRVMRRQ